ncbi:MAG: FlgD immunoglobulin-like domain containing protein [Candidatus Eisenbacteria bacterium]
MATNAVGKSLVVWTAQQSGAGHVYGQLLTAQGAREAANLDLVPSVVGRHQSNPAVASLPDGRWILTWTEEDESRDENVFYRFLAANGTPTGTVRQANTDIFSDVPQQNPAVMVLDDKMLVVWSDGRTSTLDAWGRWFDFDGEPLGSESLLREAADSPGDLDPRAIRGTGDGFAVQWFGGIDNRQRMMTRFFNADGTGRTDSFAFDDPIFGVLMRGGRLAPAADGKWIATWSDNRTFAFDCYAREIDATGNAGPVHTIYSRPKSASQIYGDIAMFPDGRAVVVWSDMQYGSLTIFGRFLDETGQPVGSSFQVSGVPANALFDTVDSIEGLADYSPAVSASADGFVVTWAINQEGGRLNAFAQYYRPDGNPVGGNFRIAPDAITSLQRSPRPAMIPGGGFVIVLEISNANNGGDVFLQRYAADGLPIGNRINCADSTPAAQIDPDVAVSPFGEILVTWVDRRGGGWDIWSQRFSANGDRIGSNVSLHGEDEPFSDQLRPSGAIAGDRTITVWETRPNLDGLVEARLEIFPTFGPDGSTQRRGEIRTFLVNADRVAKGAKYPQAAMAPNGNFIITFWDNSSGQTDLVVQRYDPDGNPMGDSYSMHGTGTDGSRVDPNLEVPNDTLQFVWSDSRRARGWDIRSRRVDWDFSGAPSPIRLAQWEATDAPGGVHLAWQTASELDFSGFHIWRQSGESVDVGPRPDATAERLTIAPITSPNGTYAYLDATAPSGFVGYWLEAVDRNGTSEFFGPRSLRVHGQDATAWPNPFQSTVRLRLPNGTQTPVRILDVTGRVVRELATPVEGASWSWDGRDASGREVPAGIYFVRTRLDTGRSSGTEIKLLRVR